MTAQRVYILMFMRWMMNDIPTITQPQTVREGAQKLLMEVVAKDDEGHPYGYSYKEIVQMLKEQFPHRNPTINTVYYYKAQMVEFGFRLPRRPRFNIQKVLKDGNGA